jgi:AcrR family transcriptional regulator
MTENLEKTDRRIKRTHKLLQDALVELTLEKGYDAITIRDITERADVGYATFFRHYPDKGALLADVLRSMKEDLQVLMQPYTLAANPEETGRLIFQYVQDHCDLCKVLVNSTDTMSLIKPVQELGLQETEAMLGVNPQGSLPLDIVINHLMSSLVMLIRWWLDNDSPYTPEQMGKIAADLIIRPATSAALGQ